MDIDIDRAEKVSQELREKAQKYALPGWKLESALRALRVANIIGTAHEITDATWGAVEALKNAEHANV